MLIKQVIVDIAHDLYMNLEDIIGFGSCFLVVNISWESETIRFTLGVAASITSAYIVHKLKKYWEKK